MKSIQVIAAAIYGAFIFYVFNGATPLLAQSVISLYDDHGDMLRNYDSLVSNLKPGDTLVFGQDRYFEVGPRGLIGHGAATWVVDIEHSVLRLPYRKMPLANGQTPRRYLHEFVHGNARLGVVPRVKLIEMYPPSPEFELQYVRVQKLSPHAFSLRYLLRAKQMRRSARNISRDHELLHEAEVALESIVREISLFKFIGDFRSDQIYYDPDLKSWLLIDWHSGTEPWMVTDRLFQHPFQAPFVVENVWNVAENATLQLKIIEWIAEERRALRSSTCPNVMGKLQ